jgi:hypothetical protein
MGRVIRMAIVLTVFFVLIIAAAMLETRCSVFPYDASRYGVALPDPCR